MTRLCKVRILSILVIFFQPYSSRAMDPYFQACEPKECGDVTISYPFYIEGQQESFCGFPGFQVTCTAQNHTIIYLSNDAYAIQNISYFDQTLSMSNTIFLEPSFNCSLPIHNLTLEHTRFEFASNHSEVIFLQNCTNEAKSNLSYYTEFSCVVDREKRELFAVYADDIALLDLSGECGSMVSIPYEGPSSSDIEGVLKRGLVLKWNATSCSDQCIRDGGRCIYNNQTQMQPQCICRNGLGCHNRRSKSIIIGSVTAASALCTILLAVLVIYCQRRRSINKFTSLWTKGTIENQNVETFLKSYGSLAPKRYTYTDIKKMSNSFKDKLGEGGYGHVYKGKLDDGRVVAVKVLKKLKGNGEEFINEVVSICRTNHVNVVTLLGFCFERKKQALVYEYLPNGSLEKFIYGAGNPQPLPGETLLSIAVGIAKGLNYLHRGCNTRILHFDIKPHNILLDEKFCPKISDFGLARLFPKEQSHISTLEARGTIGYIAPEVFCRNFGGVSHKSDVYSFGMMVIDMVCGRTDNSVQVRQSSELYFPQWIYNKLEVEEQELAVQGITNNEENKLHRKMILVSLWCIQTYPSNRPSMNKVVEMLEGSLESLEMPPKPDLSSPSISVFHSSSTPQYN